MLRQRDINSIRKNLKTVFEQQLFEAILAQAGRRPDPLQANNFAFALRELSRHVLIRLGPNEEVKSAPWYLPELNERGDESVTRMQRMKFAIQGPLSDNRLKHDLGVDYDATMISLRRTIDNLSKFTHIEPATFNVDQVGVESLQNGALSALADLFSSMFDCRRRVLLAIDQRIDRAVVSHVIDQTLESFDQMATHYFVDEVCVEDIECTGFNSSEIYGLAQGTICATLQFGSDGDLARDDGFQLAASAGFSCTIIVDADDLSDVLVEEGSLVVNSDELWSSWRGEVDDPYPELRG